MAEIIDFNKALKNKLAVNKKHILCLEGHHKWKISKNKPFENKEGQLVSVYICSYCNKQKTVLT